MAFLSGIFLIDCPASALNNSGKFPFLPMDSSPSNNENWMAVKKLHTKQGTFPYVSAQAFRSWLRESLKDVDGWTSSPTFRDKKIAYTDADPIEYAEDDLFGYMRAPGKEKSSEHEAKRSAWREKGLKDQEFKPEKQDVNFVALTRSSPFRVSTLVSIGPVELAHDYGNMARQEGDPVPYEHEFYRTALLGFFSLDLRMAGRFYHVDRTGYKHLDSLRKQLAEAKGLERYDDGRAYELGIETRKKRVQQLLTGLGQVCGGAKLSVHYTDVVPRLILIGVSKGGSHLFATTIGAGTKGEPVIQLEALEEAYRVYGKGLLSGFYAGLARGYLDPQRDKLETALRKLAFRRVDDTSPVLVHPVEAIRAVIRDLDQKASEWLA